MKASRFSFNLLHLSAIASLSLLSACDFSTGESDSSASATTGESATGELSSGATSTGPGAQPGSESTGENAGSGSTPTGSGVETGSASAGENAEGGVPEGADGIKDLGALGATIKSYGKYALSKEESFHEFRFEVSGCGKMLIRIKKELDDWMDFQLTSADPNADQSLVIYSHYQEKRKEDHSIALPKGQYHLRISSQGHNHMPFELSMVLEPGPAAEAKGDPGNLFDEALDLGSLQGANAVLGGYVGTVDHADFYRISLPPNRTVKLSPSHVWGGAVLKVHKQDGVSGEKLHSWSMTDDHHPQRIFKTQEGGVFFIEVYSERKLGTLYRVPFGLL